MINNVKEYDITRVQIPTLKEQIKRHVYAGKHDEVLQLIKMIEELLTEKDYFNKEEQLSLYQILIKHYRIAKDYDKCSMHCRNALLVSKEGQNTPKHVEILIDIYLEFAHLERQYQNYAQARILLANILKMLESSRWQEQFSFGLLYDALGRVNIEEHNYDVGISQLQNAIHYFNQSGYKTHLQLVKTTKALANTFIEIEQYEEALKAYQALRDKFRESQDIISEAQAQLAIGEVYFYIDLKKAHENIENALTLLQSKDIQSRSTIKAYLMLAEIDETAKNYKDALEFYGKALEQIVQMDNENQFMIVFVYSKLGNLSFKVGNLDSAKDYLKNGLIYADDYSDDIKVNFFTSLGKVYTELRDYQKAERYYKRALNKTESVGGTITTRRYAYLLQQLAYNNLSQTNVEEALKYFEQAREIGKQLSLSLEEQGLVCKLRI